MCRRLIKTYETRIDARYLKGYKFERPINLYELINIIQKSNTPILDIYIRENGDIGSKIFEGYYSLEKFYTIYDNLDKQDIEGLTIRLQNNYIVYVIDETYISLMSQDNAELDDVLNLTRMDSL